MIRSLLLALAVTAAPVAAYEVDRSGAFVRCNGPTDCAEAFEAMNPGSPRYCAGPPGSGCQFDSRKVVTPNGEVDVETRRKQLWKTRMRSAARGPSFIPPAGATCSYSPETGTACRLNSQPQSLVTPYGIRP